MIDKLPHTVKHTVANLAAEIIEFVATLGDNRWGLTDFKDGFRVNVGWTEILTARLDFMRVTVDGKLAKLAILPPEVDLYEGSDTRGFYASVPGSILAVIPFEPRESFTNAVELLRPAVIESARLAARRKTGRGVKAGHSQQAVTILERIVSRKLPSPSGEHQPAEPNSPTESLMEGALHRVVSSEYERNPIARDACLKRYGSVCTICDFSFETRFGELGRGFIHVHHLTPIASIGKNYRVNPIEDLRPVCANCHAMLHKKDPPLSIEELRSIIQNNA